jgi:hypothetical protein
VRSLLTGRKCTQTEWDVRQGDPRPTGDLESAWRVHARWDLRCCGNATLVFLSLYQQLNNNNNSYNVRPSVRHSATLYMSETNRQPKSITNDLLMLKKKTSGKTVEFSVTCMGNRQAEENPDSAFADVQGKPVDLGRPDWASCL